MYIAVIVLVHFSSPWVQKIAPSLRSLGFVLESEFKFEANWFWSLAVASGQGKIISW